MANMSYCRFQNTVQDLRECYDVLDDLVAGLAAPLSADELAAAIKLVKMCKTVVAYLGDEDLTELNEQTVDGNDEDGDY